MGDQVFATKSSAIREAALHMERIDTHSHMSQEYLPLQERAEEYRHFSTTQLLGDSRVVAEGCRILYGIDPGAHLRPDAPPALFRKAEELRAEGAWQATVRALDQAAIQRQLVFCLTNPDSRVFVSHADTRRLGYIAFIDEALSGGLQYPCPDFDEPGFVYYEALCRLFGELGRLQDYLCSRRLGR